MAIFDRLEKHYRRNIRESFAIDYAQFLQLIDAFSPDHKDAFIDAVNKKQAEKVMGMIDHQIQRRVNQMARQKRRSAETTWPKNVVDELNDILGK